jgi:hypothetical protein
MNALYLTLIAIITGIMIYFNKLIVEKILIPIPKLFQNKKFWQFILKSIPIIIIGIPIIILMILISESFILMLFVLIFLVFLPFK